MVGLVCKWPENSLKMDENGLKMCFRDELGRSCFGFGKYRCSGVFDATQLIPSVPQNHRGNDS